jgi:tetratricopeptide (TPR) repeat protein
MRKVSFWALPLLLVGALTTTGFAQAAAAPAAQKQQAQLGAEEYKAFMLAWDEQDPAKKAANAEKFLTNHKTADVSYLEQMYMIMIKSHYTAKAYPKVIESADKQATMVPNLNADDKKLVMTLGMDSAARIPNNAKTEEYARKILAVNPKDVSALRILSGLLADPTTLPADQAGKDKRFAETLDITKRALAEPAPAGVPAATWATQAQLPLRHTAALVLLNMKKYDESIAESQAALKIDSKNGYAWYLTGLALQPGLISIDAQYKAAVADYNANRAGDPLVAAEKKAYSDGMAIATQKKADEIKDAFATSVVLGGPAAAQAMKSLQGVALNQAEVDKLITDKKAALGL